jgi:hypothetical protein
MGTGTDFAVLAGGTVEAMEVMANYSFYGLVRLAGNAFGIVAKPD